MKPLNERPRLSSFDALLIVVGLVVGSGIFKTPSVVAGQSEGSGTLLGLWLVGGAISLAGALCYAELASADPNPGGDYQFLERAYGSKVAFMFGWSRLAVLQTGSIAMLSFVFGDYAQRVLPLGPGGATWWAALLILAVTAVQLAGLRQGSRLQKVLTLAQLLGLALLVAGAFLGGTVATPTPAPTAAEPSGGAVGLALVFVMLTFGGWSEAAYISADTESRRGFVMALLGGVAAVTGIYLLVNAACATVLGLQAMAASEAVLADLAEAVAGTAGLTLVALLVAVSAATSTNATMLTGARGVYALGRDFRSLRALGEWHEESGTPRTALLVQAAVSLTLVGFGATAKSGFQTMVEYTAPVFWLFILMAGASLFVLRFRHPDAHRPFAVPLYPLTPLVFCAGSAFMLWSSLVHTGLGALLGLAVLAAGLPLLYLSQVHTRRSLSPSSTAVDTKKAQRIP